MPIVTGKTPAGLVQHAQKALNEKWWYVWGTFGNVLTESLLESKAKQYPTYNGGANKAIHRKHLGQTACDCVGLIKGYCMWNDAMDKPVAGEVDPQTGRMYVPRGMTAEGLQMILQNAQDITGALLGQVQTNQEQTGILLPE